MNKRKIKEKILFPFFDIFLNAFNYGFHIYTSWYLIREDYSILNAHLALLSLLMVIGIALQFNGAKVSAGIDIKRNVINLPNPLLLGLLPLLCIIVSSFWLKNVLRGNFINLLIILFIFFLHSILSTLRGVIQGQGYFYKLNISFYIEVVVKVLLLYFFLPKYRSINTPLVAILIGYIFSILHIYLSYISQNIKMIRFHGIKELLQNNYVLFFILSQFLIYSFFSIDMIIINSVHTGFAPDYAVIQKVGMIQFFVGSSIMSVFLPDLSNLNSNIIQFKTKWRLFIKILIAVLLIGQIFYIFIIPPLIPLLFGENYSNTANYVPYGGVLFAVIVIANFFITTLLSRSNRKFIIILIIAIVTVSISIFLLDKIITILIAETIIYVLVCLALYIIIKKDLKNE